MTRSPRLWFAALGGMAAYAAHLMGNYWLVPAACRWGTTVPLLVLTVVLLAVAVASTAVARELYRGWTRRAGHPEAAASADGAAAEGDGDAAPPGSADRIRFMALFGLLLGLLSIALIVFGGTANVFFDPCQGTA